MVQWYVFVWLVGVVAGVWDRTASVPARRGVDSMGVLPDWAVHVGDSKDVEDVEQWVKVLQGMKSQETRFPG